MKNREEYQASIFAKRDALLAKRKKNITTAVTGGAAVAILIVSVAALPSFSKEITEKNSTTVIYTSNPEIHTEYTTQSSTNHDNLNVYDEENYFEADDQIQKEEAVAEAVPEIQSERMTMLVNYPIKKDHSNYTSEGTYYADESAEGVGNLPKNPHTNDSIISESVSEVYFGGNYLLKLIAATAFDHLSEEQKSNCINKENPDIIPVTSSSQSVYYVIFATADNISYRVMLNQSDLEFVGIEILNEKEISAHHEPLSWAEGYKGEDQ